MEVDEGDTYKGGPEQVSGTPGDSLGGGQVNMAAERGNRDETMQRKAEETSEEDGREASGSTEDAAGDDDRERRERRSRTGERGREGEGTRSRETPEHGWERGGPEERRPWDGDRRDREVCVACVDTRMYVCGRVVCASYARICDSVSRLPMPRGWPQLRVRVSWVCRVRVNVWVAIWSLWCMSPSVAEM